MKQMIQYMLHKCLNRRLAAGMALWIFTSLPVPGKAQQLFRSGPAIKEPTAPAPASDPSMRFFWRKYYNGPEYQEYFFLFPPHTVNEFGPFFKPCPLKDCACRGLLSPCTDKKLILGFIEFADGCFAYSDNRFITNDGLGNSIFHISHSNTHFTAGEDSKQQLGKYSACVKLTGIYGRPPRRLSQGHILYSDTDRDNMPPLTQQYEKENRIPEPEGIVISPNIWDIEPGDTMTFVITYKTWHAGKSITFYYNLNEKGAVKDIFVPLTPDSRLVIENIESRDTCQVVSVRGCPIEDVTFDENSVEITNLNANGLEHNIFLTLVPGSNIAPDIQSMFVASLHDSYENWPLFKIFSKKDTYNSSRSIDKVLTLWTAAAHDPNSINIYPECIEQSKGERILEYTVRFRNLGKGNANRIIVKVAPGENVLLNTLMKESIKGKCGGKEIIPITSASGVITAGLATTQPVLLEPWIGKDTIEFTINNANLKPMYEDNDPNSEGEIRFTIRAKDNISPAGIESWLAIIFNNYPPVKVDKPAIVSICPQPNKLKKCN